MLGDIETEIIAFVNKALRKNYNIDGSGNGNLDIAIQTCLNDLANHNLLVGTETTQTLVSGDTTLNYPTEFKRLISLTLIDSNSNTKRPLKKLRGGHEEYRTRMRNDSSVGFTSHYSEFNQKFFLLRPASQAFTTNIEFYKYHPQNINAIKFNEEFRNAIKFGTTFWEAFLIKNSEGESRWGPAYTNERNLRRISMNTQPSIVEG